MTNSTGKIVDHWYKYNWKIPIKGFTRWESAHPDWESGTLFMRDYVATLYMSGNLSDNKLIEFTKIEIILGGRIYRRSYSKWYSRRYTVTLAKRFANELLKNNRQLQIAINYLNEWEDKKWMTKRNQN